MRQLVRTAPLPLAAGLRLQQQPLAASPRRRSRPLRRLATASLTGSSEETEQQQQQPPAAPPVPKKPSIKQTMADLDALLGIEDKPEEPVQVRACVSARLVGAARCLILASHGHPWVLSTCHATLCCCRRQSQQGERRLRSPSLPTC